MCKNYIQTFVDFIEDWAQRICYLWSLEAKKQGKELEKFSKDAAKIAEEVKAQRVLKMSQVRKDCRRWDYSFLDPVSGGRWRCKRGRQKSQGVGGRPEASQCAWAHPSHPSPSSYPRGVGCQDVGPLWVHTTKHRGSGDRGGHGLLQRGRSEEKVHASDFGKVVHLLCFSHV